VYSAAQTRVLRAALALFAEYGVAGTSIRMIADAIGVTKAAIYYQFKTKEEIVIAAVELSLARLEWALAAAESEDSASRGREFLIRQLIEICLQQRSVARALQQDPVLLRLVTGHEPFQRMFARMQRLMLGENPEPRVRVEVAMLSGAIASGASHALVADLDDDVVRACLTDWARLFLARIDGQTA